MCWPESSELAELEEVVERQNACHAALQAPLGASWAQLGASSCPPSATWPLQSGLQARLGLQVASKWRPSDLQVASKCLPSALQVPLNPSKTIKNAVLSSNFKVRAFCASNALQVFFECNFGASWAQLGASWAPLGLHLEPLGSLLGHLGTSWTPLGLDLESLGCNLGSTSVLLGSKWHPNGLQMTSK